MSMPELRLFEAKALAEALTESGYAVSERTVQRWKKGDTKPKPQDVRAIRQVVLGHEETAPPSVESGAAGELLRLWTGAAPPPWATALTDQIKAILDEHRKLITEALQVVTEEQGDDTRRLVSEEVRRALDEAERKAPPLPGGAASPVQNGTVLDEDEANGD